MVGSFWSSYVYVLYKYLCKILFLGVSTFKNVLIGGLFVSLILVSSCAGKVINLRRLDKAITSINDWYMERGLFAMVGFVFPIFV